MTIQRFFTKASSFATKLSAALVKAAVMTIAVGVFLITVMHAMGVPVPSAQELLRGVSRLANVLS
jgi:uncharacterized protein (DUF111 family)